MRSDRAQNTGTEALNLIRNPKRKTPHIVVVTTEPMPTRLAVFQRSFEVLNHIPHAALQEKSSLLPVFLCVRSVYIRNTSVREDSR